MERLWTPWRMDYVTGSASTAGSSDRANIFLDALASAEDPDSLVVQRGTHAFVIMNLFPYNTGHLMVVPNRRVAALDTLGPDERAEMMELVSAATSVAGAVLRCDGVNIGLNIGAVAGAGIADHLHIHIVPRWLGDANFMPLTADTMVLPELLPATTARIKGEFAARQAREADGHIASTAGALVYLPGERRFVVRKADDGTIVLPKGHIESGESAADAAIREVMEETGFEATITNWLGTDRFEHAGRAFHTVYFLAVGKRAPAVDEHLGSDTLLVDPREVIGTFSFPRFGELAARSVRLLNLDAEGGSR